MMNILSRNAFLIKPLRIGSCSVALPIKIDKNFTRQYQTRESFDTKDRFDWIKILGLTFATAGSYILLKDKIHSQAALKKHANRGAKADEIIDTLPTYDYEEVSKHTTMDKRIWVTYKFGVYDITDFIAKHPGGKQILEAAGGAIDPFWDLYQQHDNEHVDKMLESLRIGNYKDGSIGEKNDNLWSNQPKRDPRLIIRSEKPFNAEPPKGLLGESFITPNHLFYVRHHLPVPEIDMSNYKITIKSIKDGNREIKLTLDDLKKFPKHTVTASLMCAGNRRSQMNNYKQTKGLAWGPGAVGTAKWSGAKLKDVLESIGVKTDEYRHVQFTGLDLDATGNPYGASIPLATAMDDRGDVILAYEMNGFPIPRDHGYPVRAFIPGTVGARCVKWLESVTVSDDESPSHWQRQDYKGFNPSVDPTAEDYAKSTAIQNLPVTSAILSPEDGSQVIAKDGFIEIQGYAWSGGGQKIIRVDVTTDRGKNWTSAVITEQDELPASRHWAWSLWKAKIPVTKGQKEIEIWAKAIDSNYNSQPDNVENIWNARGVLNNSFDKIKLKIK